MRYQVRHLVLLLVVALLIANGYFLWQNPAQREYLWSQFDEVFDDRDKRGFLLKTYVDENGEIHKYAVFVPYHMTESDRLPLVVYLNGVGKNGDDGTAPLLDGLAPAVWEAKRDFPFVVVWPQCPKGEAWTASGAPAHRALAILQKTTEEYHTDPDRVILTGISSGGSGVWSIAGANPGLFAGIAPISAGSPNPAAARAVAEAGVPVWAFYVDEDQPSLVTANRQIYQTLLKAGASPRFTEIDSAPQPGMNNHNAWDLAYRNPAFYHWLWDQNRENNQNQPRFDLIDLASPRKATDSIPKGWSIIDQSELLCRLEGREVESSVRISEPLADHISELHVEFLPSAGIERCGVGFASTGGAPSSSDWVIEVAVDSLSCGGGYSRNPESCLHAASPVAERAVKPGEWNDLRVTMEPGGEVYVELNGWPFLEMSEATFTTQGSAIFLSVDGDPGSEVRWRYPRTSGSHVDSALVMISHSRSAPELSHWPKSSATTATILRAWQSRQDATESSQIHWVHARQGINRWSRFRAAIAPVRRNPDDDVSSLFIEKNTTVYETRWWWPRAQVSRRSGLNAETVPSDFFQALDSRFPERVDRPDELLQFRSRIDGSQRLDALFTDQNHGYRGIIFDQADILSERLGDIEELFRVAPSLFFRPFSEFGYNIQSRNCVVISDRSWMAGTKCIVVEETVSNDSTVIMRRYWVDPTRHYLILRSVTLHDNRLREQIDINYSNKPGLGGIPASWSVVSMPPPASSIASTFFPGNQRLFQFAVAEIVDSKADTSRARAIEERAFPEETAYYNQHDSKWYKQLADGQRRILDVDEIIRVSTGGELSAPSVPRIKRQVTIGSLVIGLLILMVWLRFRRRAKEIDCTVPMTGS